MAPVVESMRAPVYHSFKQTSQYSSRAPKKTAEASDKMLYKNLLHSVETSKKSKDFADKPLVSDDDGLSQFRYG